MLSAIAVLVSAAALMGIFFYGLKGFIHMRVAPNNSIAVDVTADGERWAFSYPEGAVTDTLVVPVNQPVKLLMSARDVIHSFSVPALRINKTVIPRRFTTAWFTPAETGEFDLFCSEYYGRARSNAPGKIKVLAYDDYRNWVAVKSDPSIGKTPEEYGQYLYIQQNCYACHSIDGSPLIAPTLKELFGAEKKMVSGQVQTVDDDYIKRSILQPNVDVAEGFDPVMAAYKLQDKEISAIIAFIKSLGTAPVKQEAEDEG